MLCNITQNAMGQTPGGYPYPIMLCNITQNAMEQTPGGVPISHNALQHFPECHRVDTWGGTLPGPAGGVPCWGGTLPGRVPPSQVRTGGYPAQGDTQVGYPPAGYPPSQVRTGGGTLPGGYPVRTTEGVLTTRWAVCLLRSRRRTFLVYNLLLLWYWMNCYVHFWLT